MKDMGDRLDRIEKVLDNLTKGLVELREGLVELKESQKKTDEQLKITSEETKKTSEEVRKTSEEVRKTSEEVKKLSKEVDKTEKMVGNLTDGWGKFVEGLVLPSARKSFSKMGMKILGEGTRQKRKRDGEVMEVDILLIAKNRNGEKVVIAISVKSHLDSNKVVEFVKNLDRFFYFFEEYKGMELIGAVSGIRIDEGVDVFGERCGLYVFAPSGENLVIVNKKGFKPKIWR
jgi:predicted nuclease with TOPRIM domain